MADQVDLAVEDAQVLVADQVTAVAILVADQVTVVAVPVVDRIIAVEALVVAKVRIVDRVGAHQIAIRVVWLPVLLADQVTVQMIHANVNVKHQILDQQHLHQSQLRHRWQVRRPHTQRHQLLHHQMHFYGQWVAI